MKYSQIFCVVNYVINTEGRKQRKEQLFLASLNIKKPRRKSSMDFVGGFPSSHSADNIVRINYNLAKQEIALNSASAVTQCIVESTPPVGFQLGRGDGQMCFSISKNYNTHFTFVFSMNISTYFVYY